MGERLAITRPAPETVPTAEAVNDSRYPEFQNTVREEYIPTDNSPDTDIREFFPSLPANSVVETVLVDDVLQENGQLDGRDTDEAPTPLVDAAPVILKEQGMFPVAPETSIFKTMLARLFGS